MWVINYFGTSRADDFVTNKKIILSTHVADLLNKSFKYHYLEMMVTNLFNVLSEAQVLLSCFLELF